MRAPETCPVCGADVPRKARACPECGSDATTGWSEDAEAQSLGLPDDEFDYDEFVKKEFEGKTRKPHWIWLGTAIVLLALFLFFFLNR